MLVNLRSKSYPPRKITWIYYTRQYKSTYARTRLLVTDVPPTVDYSDLISVFLVPQVLEPL